jgi:predicted extracellular nuclease
MNTARVLTALIAAATFTACTQLVPKPIHPSTRLQTIELSFDANPKTANLRPHAVQQDSVLAFDSFNPSTTPAASVSSDANFRYILRTFKFTNTTNNPLNNITFYAYNQAANNKGGTAIKNLSDFVGGTDSANAQSLLPTHGMSGNVTVNIVSGLEDLQVFSTSEASAVQTDARNALPPIIGASDSVLEYGFVARSLAAGGGRTIGANTCVGTDCNRGQVTVAYKIPLSQANNTYSFTATFVVSTETIARVTRSPEESDSAANTRAAALSASQVVLGGVTSTYTGTQIAQGNAKISTTPALLLEPSCVGGAFDPIYTIQGSGTSAALTGTRTTEGVVVGKFQSSDNTGLQGFYIQDRFGDGDINTSDGILIDQSTTTPDTAVSVGDYVRVAGTVNESFTLTSIEPSSITVCGTRATPNPTKIMYPLANGQVDLEKFEGMLIQIPTQMTVTEMFQLGQFGQVTLSSGGTNNQASTDNRLDQFTQFNAPGVTGNAAHNTENGKRTIVLDDGRSDSNPSVNTLGRGGNPLTASNTLRGGDTITDLVGVMDYRFSAYRIQPTAPANFQATNVRPSSPSVAGTLRVGSFNVLNYFNTLNPSSGTTFTPTDCSAIAPRGANTIAEFSRQKDKTVAAIRALNADVLGLIEIQNNGSDANSAIVDLVTAVNVGQPIADQYAVVADPPAPERSGCDAIKVAFIYKPNTVSPVAAALSTATVSGVTVSSGVAFTVGNGTDPNGDTVASFDNNNRKPIAVTFKQISNNQEFTAVMNHFKSKGSSSGGIGDADAGDGQGFSNGTRVRASKDLKAWLATDPTGTTDPDYLIMGDLNAYAKEDPIAELETTYINLLPSSTYSYAFGGNWGSLDHALGSTSLNAQLAGAAKWHINADEPTTLDYNTQLDNGTVIKTPAQEISLYAADAFRSSDHDPVVVGLNLVAVPNTFTVNAGTLSTSGFTAGTAGSATSTITINRNTFTDPVTLSLEVSPASAGITANFTNNPNSTGTSGMALNLDNTVAANTYTLTVKGTSGATVVSSNTHTITVSAPCTVSAVAVSSAGSATSVNVNSTLQLTATVTSNPTNCSSAVTWSSNDTNKVTVTSSGLLAGVATGSAIITATSTLNTGISGTFNVTVNAGAATNIVISQVYGAGGNAGATYNRDFVEIFNRGTTSVSLTGYTVQYASATGTGNFTVGATLAGTIAPGGYYLVGMSSGTNGVALPSVDSNGTSAMATAAGKVVLVNSTSALACNGGSTPCGGTQSALIVDLVGYGTANFYEGSAATAALSAILAAVRNGNGCTDTNQNGSDFTAATPNPRNSSSTAVTCP